MFETQIQKIQQSLQPFQAALITDDANRRYVTGFPSSAGAVLITPERAQFFIDSRYFESAQKNVTACEVVLMKQFLPQLAEALIVSGTQKLFLETRHTDYTTVLHYREELDPVVIADEPMLDDLLHDLRVVKSPEEAENIRKAQKLTDRTFDYVLKQIGVGKTEREIALDMEFFMRRLGSEGVSFDFIVISGKNSSLPHGVPTDKKIEAGDFVTMDFGAVVNGYRSDMTRTVAVGFVTDEQKAVYETVLAAQCAALSAIHAGAACNEIDRIARDRIAAAGYGEYFGHGLGHSVGLEIHESPACSPNDKTVLQSGTVMTVEPGIYLPDRFGVRIEDMVLVTETGCENLTKSPKELIVL